MATQGKADTPRFDINATVVFRLGEELISDVVQAIVEIVKNSYDADASWVKVTIDTHARNEWGRRYTDATGVIRVQDDGDGMDESTIRRGWLTIANSPKRQDKASGRVTRRGRTPIGDKGLGRLGVQRLAQNVEIVTTSHAGDRVLRCFLVEGLPGSSQPQRRPAELRADTGGLKQARYYTHPL